MKKTTTLIAHLILLGTIGFNLYLYYPETKILADPNDNIFQYSLVGRTDWVWKNYGCPFSLSCLPNLVDHNVTAWAEGYPLPFYYSHIPQIITVSSYHIFVKPLTSLFQTDFSLYQYYNFSKYLLLAFFPLPVFIALRLVGFAHLTAAVGAFFAAHFSTDGLYGIDPPSFLWRGYGLTSQLYAVFFAPLGIAFTFRALQYVGMKWEVGSGKLDNELGSERKRISHFSFQYLTSHIPYLTSLFAVIFLTLTIAGHLGIGMITLLATAPLILFDPDRTNIIKRTIKLFFIVGTCILLLGYWIIPAVLLNRYHIISFWDPIWKFDSYGWYDVVRQFLGGELFDWGRPPVISALVLIGFFALVLSTTRYPLALSFALMMLFFFGRTTWNGLIDLIPGMKDFHLHRFIVGVHLTGIFLLPAALETLTSLLKRAVERVLAIIVLLSRVSEQDASGNGHEQTISLSPTIRSGMFYLTVIVLVTALAYLTAAKTVEYNSLNSRWIAEARTSYRYDEYNFQNLLSYLKARPPARIYAGRPGNWGKQFRLGSSEMYMLLGIQGLDMTQFLPETWSMMSENDQNFDERIGEDYDLLNVKTIVTDSNHGFPSAVSFDKKFGPFEVYNVPTTGWFDVVTSPMFVKSKKTDFLNIVYLWHRGFPRRFKMHPLISIENNPTIPPSMDRVIQMTNEVSFVDLNPQPKNIFADFPFTFPQATPSGEIQNEMVEKQTYSATVTVPQTCSPHCTIMFKMSYHPGWFARLDGQPVTKFAVFPYYLAVRTTPGTHTVEFSYRPSSFKILLFLITPVLLFGWIVLFRKLRRQLPA